MRRFVLILACSCFFSFGSFGQYNNVVINEVSGDSGQSDGSNDGILELAGPAGTDISCMVISNSEWAVVIPPGTVIPGDGIFLIGCSEDASSSGVGTPSTSGLTCSVCDFPGLPLDLDVCDAANADYYDPAASGFTIDNQNATDGDQIVLFLPDGTVHDAVYWAGGATGNADNVVVSSDNPYTLGTAGVRGDGAVATAVPMVPPAGSCDTENTTYTMPAISDPVWVDIGANVQGCNTSYQRTDAPGTATPSSLGGTSAGWITDNHPTPGALNDSDRWLFTTTPLVLCAPGTVTFTLEVYNYQHVSDDADTYSGVDNLQIGSYVQAPATDPNAAPNADGVQPWASYATDGAGTTTMTYTTGTLPVGSHTFVLQWDDYTNCCGSGSITSGNECYERETFTVVVAEPLAVSVTDVACPGDFEAGIGVIDFSQYVTAGSDVSYELYANGALTSTSTTGVFNLSSAYDTPLTVEVIDESGCGTDVTINVGADCRAAPPCPEITNSEMDDADGIICPGTQVCFDITEFSNLPEGGTIDFYTDPVNAWDPYTAASGTYIGSADLVTGTGCEASTVTIASGDVTAYDVTGNTYGLNSDIAAGNSYELDASGVWQNNSGADYNGFGTANGPGTGIYISQFVYDPDENNLTPVGHGCMDGSSMDGGTSAEVIEITGPAGTDLSCYVLSDGEGTLTFPPGTVINSNGVLVIGSACAANEYPNIDLIATPDMRENLTFILGNSSDQIYLWDASGTVVDALAYNSGQDSDLGTWDTAVLPGEPEPTQFCYTFDDTYCGGPFTVSAIINPFTEFDDPTTAGNAGDPNDCFGEDAERWELFNLSMDCPAAELVPTEVYRCETGGDTGEDITVNLSGLTSGNYLITYSVNGTLMTRSVAAPATSTTINIPAPTTGDTEVVLVSVYNDADGSGTQEADDCSGIVDTDEALINIAPASASASVSASTNITSCSDPNGTVTFSFTGSDGPFEFEYTVNGGPPITAIAATSPFTITDIATPGTYEITSLEVNGCPGTVAGSQSITSASAPVAASVTSSCDGVATIDLDDLNLGTPNYSISIVYNTATSIGLTFTDTNLSGDPLIIAGTDTPGALEYTSVIITDANGCESAPISSLSFPCPLSVDFLHFTAEKREEVAVLSWATATEENNAYFEVEHSLDGVFFESIGWVEGKGNSTERTEYNFTHSKPANGLNYYKLKQVDFDGSFSYSNTEVVSFGKETSIRVVPTLAQNEILLLMDNPFNKELSMEVFAVNGQKVMDVAIPQKAQMVSVNISELPAGSYFVRLVNDSKVFTERFIKQ